MDRGGFLYVAGATASVLVRLDQAEGLVALIFVLWWCG